MPAPREEAPRRLMILRHAKSSWKRADLSDHDRPLSSRGRRDAPRVAERLVELGWCPERVVSSDAKRTRQTWKLMAQAFPDAQVDLSSDLYLGSVAEVRAELEKLSEDVTTVLVIGHNPGCEEVVAELAGVGVTMTTANVALLTMRASGWASAVGGSWQLEGIVRPKEL